MRDPYDQHPTEIWFPDGAPLRLILDPAVRSRDDVATAVATWFLHLATAAGAVEALVPGLRSLGLEVTVDRARERTTVRVAPARAPRAAEAPGRLVRPRAVMGR